MAGAALAKKSAPQVALAPRRRVAFLERRELVSDPHLLKPIHPDDDGHQTSLPAEPHRYPQKLPRLLRPPHLLSAQNLPKRSRSRRHQRLAACTRWLTVYPLPNPITESPSPELGLEVGAGTETKALASCVCVAQLSGGASQARSGPPQRATDPERYGFRGDRTHHCQAAISSTAVLDLVQYRAQPQRRDRLRGPILGAGKVPICRLDSCDLPPMLGTCRFPRGQRRRARLRGPYAQARIASTPASPPRPRRTSTSLPATRAPTKCSPPFKTNHPPLRYLNLAHQFNITVPAIVSLLRARGSDLGYFVLSWFGAAPFEATASHGQGIAHISIVIRSGLQQEVLPELPFTLDNIQFMRDIVGACTNIRVIELEGLEGLRDKKKAHLRFSLVIRAYNGGRLKGLPRAYPCYAVGPTW
ncbi:hypothetical protein BDK51DRAFT_41468 [Blyttiomyces helicus]|uniref:Uncharacterized protein n=1 Tax=Blyttiomyces helicus TaxID=388810 RepID=A0A4P9W9P0_9FUNG|nr:hypothetical protein BDK51DRAFT_41468 [Blyttiomyces helicus]|eukprot:RKO88235.1 hypothetical protein BDK51DRAFT_41468 [Blyttiomyces helicus]